MKKERFDRPLYVALHLHQRYIPGRELRRDTRLVYLFGIRIWLEPYLQRFYIQTGAGVQIHRISRGDWRALPTGEIQLGGFYRPHRYTPKRLRREGIERW